MTNPKTKGGSTIAWWLGWITLTIVSFFVSCYFWTWFIAKHIGPMDKPGTPILWVSLVFGSWMVLLVPLIVVMYNKVDKAYEDARIARETAEFNKAKDAFKIRSVYIEESRRRLSKNLTDKLKKIPETIRHGHLVTVTLDNGQKFPHVFVKDRKEILGIYGVKEAPFQPSQIIDVEPQDLDKLPHFHTEEWLRLDGVGST